MNCIFDDNWRMVFATSALKHVLVVIKKGVGKVVPMSTHNFYLGGHLGRVGNVAEFQRSKSFDHLTAVTGVGSSPALATCETSQVLLAGVSGGFPGVLPFRPTYDWLVSI